MCVIIFHLLLLSATRFIAEWLRLLLVQSIRSHHYPCGYDKECLIESLYDATNLRSEAVNRITIKNKNFRVFGLHASRRRKG